MNTQQHAVTQLRVEREMTESTAPLPADILNAANTEPRKPRYVCASDYAEAVHALRVKGFTWREVTDWLVSKGADFSMQAIIAGYRKRFMPQSMPLTPGQISRRELQALRNEDRS